MAREVLQHSIKSVLETAGEASEVLQRSIKSAIEIARKNCSVAWQEKFYSVASRASYKWQAKFYSVASRASSRWQEKFYSVASRVSLTLPIRKKLLQGKAGDQKNVIGPPTPPPTFEPHPRQRHPHLKDAYSDSSYRLHTYL